MKSSYTKQEKQQIRKTALLYYKNYTDYLSEKQEEVVEKILKEKDTLAILPTASGKSICFQIPARLLSHRPLPEKILPDNDRYYKGISEKHRGLTIVICPLISLMKDQVDGINEMTTGNHDHIKADYINSTRSRKEILSVYRNLKELDIIYISPESLYKLFNCTGIQNIKISLIVVDEAHLFSLWGFDFRKSYLLVPIFIRNVRARKDSNPIVAAFTATANDMILRDFTRDYSLNSLDMDGTPVDEYTKRYIKKTDALPIKLLKNDFEAVNIDINPDNINFQIIKLDLKKYVKSSFIKEYIFDHTNECGVIFFYEKKALDKIYEFLLNVRENTKREDVRKLEIFRYYSDIDPEDDEIFVEGDNEFSKKSRDIYMEVIDDYGFKVEEWCLDYIDYINDEDFPTFNTEEFLEIKNDAEKKETLKKVSGKLKKIKEISKSRKKDIIQNRFKKCKSGVMLATSAFGTGVSNRNIRYSIHYHMPDCIENYYQEAGRCGRDKERIKSEGKDTSILLYTVDDISKRNYQLEYSYANLIKKYEEADIEDKDKKIDFIDRLFDRKVKRLQELERLLENNCINCSDKLKAESKETVYKYYKKNCSDNEAQYSEPIVKTIEAYFKLDFHNDYSAEECAIKEYKNYILNEYNKHYTFMMFESPELNDFRNGKLVSGDWILFTEDNRGFNFFELLVADAVITMKIKGTSIDATNVMKTLSGKDNLTIRPYQKEKIENIFDRLSTTQILYNKEGEIPVQLLPLTKKDGRYTLEKTPDYYLDLLLADKFIEINTSMVFDRHKELKVFFDKYRNNTEYRKNGNLNEIDRPEKEIVLFERSLVPSIENITLIYYLYRRLAIKIKRKLHKKIILKQGKYRNYRRGLYDVICDIKEISGEKYPSDIKKHKRRIYIKAIEILLTHDKVEGMVIRTNDIFEDIFAQDSSHLFQIEISFFEDGVTFNYVSAQIEKTTNFRDDGQEVLYLTIPTEITDDYLYFFDDMEDFI